MNECPACSSTKAKPTKTIGVYTCSKCGAIFGECYRGESYAFVQPFFTKEEPPAERIRYYDFRVLGTNGVERRHGWYDTQTHLIVQTG